jgi:hypothetical protein
MKETQILLHLNMLTFEAQVISDYTRKIERLISENRIRTETTKKEWFFSGRNDSISSSLQASL